MDSSYTRIILQKSIYYNIDSRLTDNFNLTVMDVFNSYNNICYFLNRVKPYNSNGRNQTAEESDAMSKEIFAMLDKYGIDVTVYNGCLEDYDRIVDEVMRELTFHEN